MARGLRVIGAALCISSLACGNPPALRVVEAREVGTVAQSHFVIGRDGGGSALLWGRLVWVLGDTVSTVPDVDGTPGTTACPPSRPRLAPAEA